MLIKIHNMHKATPITKKACSSPAKMNEALVYGEADAADKFLDVGGTVKEAIDKEKGQQSGSSGSVAAPPEKSAADKIKDISAKFDPEKFKLNFDTSKIPSDLFNL